MSPEENATIDGTDVGLDDIQETRHSDDPALDLEPGELQESHHRRICRVLLQGIDLVDASKDPADRTAN